MRIASKRTSAEQITEALGVEPTLSRQAGSVRGPGLIWESNLWHFELADDHQAAQLASRIDALLNKLEPQSEEIRTLATSPGITAVLWCACYGKGPENSITLSPELLSRMASLSIGIDVSIYNADD